MVEQLARRRTTRILYKLAKQYNPANMVVWATIAEQYRVECVELEARPAAAVIKKFLSRKCAIV